MRRVHLLQARAAHGVIQRAVPEPEPEVPPEPALLVPPSLPLPLSAPTVADVEPPDVEPVAVPVLLPGPPDALELASPLLHAVIDKAMTATARSRVPVLESVCMKPPWYVHGYGQAGSPERRLPFRHSTAACLFLRTCSASMLVRSLTGRGAGVIDRLDVDEFLDAEPGQLASVTRVLDAAKGQARVGFD